MMKKLYKIAAYNRINTVLQLHIQLAAGREFMI